MPQANKVPAPKHHNMGLLQYPFLIIGTHNEKDLPPHKASDLRSFEPRSVTLPYECIFFQTSLHLTFPD